MYKVSWRELEERDSNPNRKLWAVGADKNGNTPKYETLQEADKVAGEEAAKHEGREYLILQAVRSVRAAPAPIIRTDLS